MTFAVEVITIDGSRLGVLEDSRSGSAFSAPVMSVPMSVVLSGAKKLRVIITFGGSFTVSVVGTYLFAFVSAYEVLLKICLLRLFAF
jgi:hypothetical protein